MNERDAYPTRWEIRNEDRDAERARTPGAGYFRNLGGTFDPVTIDAFGPLDLAEIDEVRFVERFYGSQVSYEAELHMHNGELRLVMGEGARLLYDTLQARVETKLLDDNEETP